MTDRAAALVEVLGGDVAVVAVALRKAARQARVDHRPLGVRLERLIADFESAERAWTRRPVAVPATGLDRGGCARPSSGPVLGVAEVARRAAISAQAVRKAAATGRLGGRVGPEGRWQFTDTDVQAWQDSRKGRHRT
jgi:hypothetical protein